MSRKTLVLFYESNYTTKTGLTYEMIDLVDENNVKQGFLTSSIIQDQRTPPSPGYYYNPFMTNKTINLPQGVITYIYENVNTDTVVVNPVYEAGFKNSTVIREVISVVDNLVKRKLIIEYDV